MRNLIKLVVYFHVYPLSVLFMSYLKILVRLNKRKMKEIPRYKGQKRFKLPFRTDDLCRI